MSAGQPVETRPHETELLASALAAIELALAHHAASQELVRDAYSALRQLADARCGTVPADPPVDLTLRQRQVLSLVRGGSSNRDIASALSISERTVKQHLHMVFTKLGVRDRAQAAAVGGAGEAG